MQGKHTFLQILGTSVRPKLNSQPSFCKISVFVLHLLKAERDREKGREDEKSSAPNEGSNS